MVRSGSLAKDRGGEVNANYAALHAVLQGFLLVPTTSLYRI